MMIQPIETVYNGYRFRSRLEARWAVFFDTLGVKYEYEKEGFDLDGLWYLPDFWLSNQHYWIEIKGVYPNGDEWEKAARLAEHSKFPVAISQGNIDVSKQQHYVFRLFPNGIAGMSTNEQWTECPYCKKVELVMLGFCSNLSCDCLNEKKWEAMQKIVPTKRGIIALVLLNSMRRYNIRLTLTKEKLHVHVPKEVSNKFFIPAINEHEKEILKIMAVRDEIEMEFQKKKGSHSPRLIAAYTAARQARFEHGETPHV